MLLTVVHGTAKRVCVIVQTHTTLEEHWEERHTATYREGARETARPKETTEIERKRQINIEMLHGKQTATQ